MASTSGTYAFENGVLTAESPHLPRRAFTRPANLAASRFDCEEPPPEGWTLADGRDLLVAAFGILPFARRPLPEPRFGEDVTPAARKAFALLAGFSASPQDDAQQVVLRGEPYDFLVFAVRNGLEWTAGAITVNEGTLTFRLEDVWQRTPPQFRCRTYRANVLGDNGLHKTLDDVAPDARIFIDHAKSGGFLISFTPTDRSL